MSLLGSISQPQTKQNMAQVRPPGLDMLLDTIWFEFYRLPTLVKITDSYFIAQK